MSTEIKTIVTKRFGIKANCYLIKADLGYILIDTGWSNKCTDLEKELESAGCNPGKLKLIILTHGDFDHTGNCAYLRKKFSTKIAMHYDDSGIVERGDMFWNRKKSSILIRIIVNVFLGLSQAERFKPDLTIDEGYDLSESGFDAKVLHLPGHSKGSIGILTAGGDLFCGDLFMNMNQPTPTSLVDDSTELKVSIEKLKSLKISTVYPGHGKPFPMNSFTK